TPSGGLPGARTPAQPRPRPKTSRPPGLIVPHAVPVVMTPPAGHHSPPDPDPVIYLGPDVGDQLTVLSPLDPPSSVHDAPAAEPPAPPKGWTPVGPRPAPATVSPGQASPGPASPEGSAESPATGRPS
ncbi:MAG: hypothetical protein QM582_03945, partial [Micropruina sp.]